MLLASSARRPTARRVAARATRALAPSAALAFLGATVSAPSRVLQAQQPAPAAPAATAAATVVRGVVRDAAGAPVERAIVRLVPVLPVGSTGAAGVAAQTDRRGAFRLAAAPGRHVLRAWRAGADTAVRTLDLASGDSVDVTLVLRDADRAGAAVLAAVRVRATATSYRADTAATATRTPTPLRDLPQAVQVVTGAVLRDQQALLLTDALRNVAGATTFSGYNDLTLRGFRTTPGNFALNGQRGGLADSYGPQVSYAIERVEVLKGPASVLFGNAAPGGVVNVVQKLPRAVAARSLELSTGSFGLRRAVADATGPLDARGTWRYRLVAGGEDSDSFMRFVGGRNWLVSPALTWAPSARTEVTAVGSYFRRDETGGGWYNRGILAPGGDVNALPRDWSGHEPGDRTGDRAPAAQLLARHALSPNVSLHLLARAGRTDYRQQYHHLNWGGLAEDGRTLSRHFRDFATDTDERVVNAYATAQGRWLGVGHTAVVGLDANDTRYAWTYAQSAAGVPTLDILAPVYGRGDEARYRGDRYSADNVDRTRMLGGYVQDQLDLAPVLGGAAVKALVGARWERYRFRNTNVDRTATVTDPAVAPSRSGDASDASVLVPRVGLVYQPTRAVALYTNYSESFEPQYSNLPLAGGPFPPERGRQVELGVKHDLGRRLSTTAALFEIRKANVLMAVPDNQDLLRAVGGVRSRGAELSVAGLVTARLSVLANYAYTDAAVSAATDGTVGQRLPMAPRHASNVWATWRASLLGRTLALSGGANHVGARATLDGPGFTVPAYTTADAAARVTLDAAGRLELAVNGYNLADRRFVVGSFGRDANWLGAPRSVRVALRTAF